MSFFDRTQKTDEIINQEGLRIERRGRSIVIDTHRSKEQQQHIMEVLAAERPKIPARIAALNTKLLEIIHKYGSLELLSSVSFHNTMHNPNTYEETTFSGRPPFVEHLALLELKGDYRAKRSAFGPDTQDVTVAQEILDKIFQETAAYYSYEAADPKRTGPPTPEQELKFHTILHELVVRNQTYYPHWEDVVRELFSAGDVEEWMLSNLGFTIDHALKCIAAPELLISTKLRMRATAASCNRQELLRATRDYKRSGKYTGPPQLKELLSKLRNLREKELKRAVDRITTEVSLRDFNQVYSYTASEVAERAGVTYEVAKKFLDMFSMEFGQVEGEYEMPQPTHELMSRPFIHFDDQYYCPAGHLLLFALKPRIERIALNSIFSYRYQKMRAKEISGRPHVVAAST